MHAITVNSADLMLGHFAPAPFFVAHVFVFGGQPLTLELADEAELFEVAADLSAYVLDYYADGSMVLTEWPALLASAPCVLPLPLAA